MPPVAIPPRGQETRARWRPVKVRGKVRVSGATADEEAWEVGAAAGGGGAVAWAGAAMPATVAATAVLKKSRRVAPLCMESSLGWGNQWSNRGEAVSRARNG